METPKDPWVGTPVGVLTSEKKGQLWKYTIPAVKADLSVKCVYEGTVVKGGHLDVSMVDETTAPGTIPAGIQGFCGTGKIDKLKSTTDVSDAILEGSLCSKNPASTIAPFFGPKGQKLSKTVNQFCKKYMQGSKFTNGIAGNRKKCAKNIRSKDGAGWAKVFCAANTIISKDPESCDISNDCTVCTTDIQDFGWLYAINKWDKTKSSGPKPGGTCLKISDLPPDLLECQRGLRIQYLLDDQWVTYKAIPHGYRLCEASGSFNSNDDPELFQNKMRFTECGEALLPPGTCPSEDASKCDAEDGFSVVIKSQKSVEKSELSIVDMVDQGKLICNPNKYPGNPKGCLNEPINPCPTCTGKCAPTGYKSPCDGNSPCHTCPVLI
jgi:hypothetical protein